MEVSIFAYRLLRLPLNTNSYRAGLLVHMLYSHEISKLSRVSVDDCVSDFRCNFKTRNRFWRQIFSCFNVISSNFCWPHILKGKADGMHLKNHLLRRRRFSRFFRLDLTRDMIRKVIKLYRPTELLLWVPWNIHGGNRSKISWTHTGELNQFLVLRDVFWKRVPDD